MDSRTSDAPWLIMDAAGLIVDSSMASGSIHKPVLVYVLSVIKTRPRIRTVHTIFVNVTSHPASQNLTTDSREYVTTPGTMCPNLAFAGSCGSASVQV